MYSKCTVMYSNVQSLKMYREGENYIWFIKIWWRIIDAISHNLSGQYVRFTAWFGTILIYSMIWNDIWYTAWFGTIYDIQHDLERFWFTAWFGTIYDLQHDLERFWFTAWFETVLIYGIIYSPYISCSSNKRCWNLSDRIHWYENHSWMIILLFAR